MVDAPPAVSLIVQLSDIHLLENPEEQAPIFDALVEAIEKSRSRFRRSPDLLVITGDVFDSVNLDPTLAIEAFHVLHRRVLDAIGRDVPTIVIPGNHDRRKLGLLGPHRDDLFDHLARAADQRTFVHGTTTPFLSAVVPQSVHGQPFWVIAYDSTYLPRGMVSAGGVLRQEDLLHAAARIDGRHPDWPVLFLLHHHLVPTPLTDVGHIDARRTHPVLQWGVKHVLPAIVANADREELTMTALGAGTALSTLHALGRAVLVLHGHKHYATARLLDGMRSGQGDVLLVSAGSCGTAQPWNPTGARDTARLWPSFNFIELDDARAVVHDVSFGWKGASAGRVVFRPLVNAQRQGSQWSLLPLPPTVEEEEGPTLTINRANYRLIASDRDPSRWDIRCVREVVPQADRPHRYVESVEGLDGATLLVDGEPERQLPDDIELTLGRPTVFEVHSGVARTLDENRRLFGSRSVPFGSVSLMNRYRSEDAVLEVEGIPAAGEAFASVTDLGTGLESPAPIRQVSDHQVRLVREQCAPRTLLRIYWPLAREV